MDDINVYKEQLEQVELALSTASSASEKEELLSLKHSLSELLLLTGGQTSEENTNNVIEDEFALFMSEMQKDGAVPCSNNELTILEGTKCRAPHKHQWGSITYHNAMICTVESNDHSKVRVLFTHPTHKEMVPCPYYFKEKCKFSEESCHYSHGEVILTSSLQDYIEPNFDNLIIGNRVLAKQSELWHPAKIKSINNETCVVKFESNKKLLEVVFEDILPLESHTNDDDDDSSDSDEDYEDAINYNLLITPSDQALGEWEKYTKGIGSKLMQKMGYIIGNGLGKKCNGRVDPVTAVILPAGKSLDHCMNLRERAGGDKNLFSAEKKLKSMQKKEEARSQREYEKEKNRVDVFSFINKTLGASNNDQPSKSKHRQDIKKDSCRTLNVASLQIDENIKRVERDLYKIRESLGRQANRDSLAHKQLLEKLYEKENELKSLQSQAVNIRNEQGLRNNKKKLTIF